METFDFRYAAGQPPSGRAFVGVVSSGDLEVLVEPGRPGVTTVKVTTSVNGYGALWRAQIDRMFGSAGAAQPAVAIEINDFGATPGVVALRLAEAIEAIDAGAANGGAQGRTSGARGGA